MTTKRRLIPESEVRGMIELCLSFGLLIGAVDIRVDGVTIHPPKAAVPTAGSAYDSWKNKDKDREPPSRR